MFIIKDIPTYFIIGKTLGIRSCSAAKPMHFIDYNIMCMHMTRLVWQTKRKLVTCITCVSHVLTGSYVHAKIMHKSACACQILSF